MLKPLQVDPCAVTDGINCRAVPINQVKDAYDREVVQGDICMTAKEFSELQKSYREILRRCGEKCK